MKLQLSDKDRKTLFIFLSLIVIACSFIFIYLPNTKKAASIEDETAQLEVQLQDYQNKETMVKSLKDEMATFQEESQEILTHYPENLTEEKVIRIIRDMESDSEVNVNKVGFSTPAVFYSSESAQADPNADPNAVAATTSLTGYKMDIALEFVAKYEDLKKAIDYINNYADCMSITALTLGYNSLTGDLTGKMTIVMYYVPDGGTPYVVPEFGNIPSGVSNLFGRVVTNPGTVSPLPASKEANQDSKKDASKSNSKK